MFTNTVEISGGFCMLHSDPKKNYGVSAPQITFICKGPKGAVQWMIGTDWYPEAARRHLSKFESRYEPQPQAWDIGYHSPVAMYDGQKPMQRECHILGGECYYDGSSLQADEWLEGFRNGGTAWLWPKLEQYYRATFEDGEYPDLTPVIRRHEDTKTPNAPLSEV